MKNKNIILTILLLLGGAFLGLINVFAQAACPSQTTVGDTFATLVGEIQDNGGDPNITAWFEWGLSSAFLDNRTPDQSLFVPNPPQRFCATISNLQPCTTYFYRAASRNSGGTNYGSIYSFRTSCSSSSNLFVSCSASPNPANVGQTVVFTANVSGGTGSYFYSWSGACSSNASTCSNIFSSPGTYIANLMVTSGNQTRSASCSVVVNQQQSVIYTSISGSNQSSNQPPVPVIAFTPEDIRPGTIVTFDASNSYDPDGNIIAYEWRVNNDFASSNKIFSRALASGTYRIKLTITDNQGVQASKEMLISVGRNTYVTQTRTIVRRVRVPVTTQEAGAKLVDLLVEPYYSVNICSRNSIQLTLVNNTSVNRQVIIKANGEAGDWFEPQERVFTLEPNSTHIINWTVDVPCYNVVKSRNYNVDFKVSTRGANYLFSSNLQVKDINTSLLGFIGAFLGGNILWLLLLLLIILLIAFLWYKFRKLEEAINKKQIIQYQS